MTNNLMSKIILSKYKYSKKRDKGIPLIRFSHRKLRLSKRSHIRMRILRPSHKFLKAKSIEQNGEETRGET